MRPSILFLVLSLLFPLVAAAAPQDRRPSQEEKEAVAKLPEKYRAWIEEVDLLLSEDERKTFLALAKDYQRDAFIEQFWTQRDTIRRTSRNEFRERWQENARLAREMFGDFQDGRSRVLLLNGLPEERLESNCPQVYQPLEAWFYSGSDRLSEPFAVVFYRKWGEKRFRIWTRFEGSLAADGVFEQRPNTGGPVAGPEKAAGAPAERAAAAAGQEQAGPPPDCGDYDHSRKINAAINWVSSQGTRWVLLEARLNYPQDPPGAEWVSAFNSYSTDLPEGAAALLAKLDVAFPGRRQNRTVVQGLLNVTAESAAQAAMGEARAYNLLLTGEVLREGSLLDSFRYKFDMPVSGPATSLPLAFERQLRPGDYTLIVKLEDVNGGRFFREERALTVPALENVAPAALPSASADPEAAETARVLADAYAALRSGETTVQLVPPHGELQTGMQRFDALTTGPIASVTFQLDGKPVLTKKSPPFSVELDLGSIPRTRTLAVTAYDGAGGILASDELLLNAPARRFRVRLVEPRKGKVYDSSLRAEAEVETPDGETVERVEMYLNDTRVATLYQPPYALPMVLPKDQPLSYVRAVAFLADGTSAEQLVFVNAPDYLLPTVNVDLVELYTTVLDRRGRPVSEGLTEKDFSVTEDGARQTISRFERVDDLPIHAAVAIDVSASMLTSLEKTQAAALQFFQKMVQPKDRAALITFNDHPVLNVRFTKDVKTLAGGLAGLKAERGTSLYDSLVFSFYNFNGIRGRRALLLLSDGKDEGSRFTYEEALEFARRSGVTVYVIGLGEDVEKKKLARFAEETGGRAFFPRKADELTQIYAAIEEELRSQYLIAYQSSGNRTDSGFRTVELKVGKSGLGAKTMRGYYP
ncbi:MAG TPA: VWA domain-containing protein [Thermoanaerobaculia bacterium]|nr:VWA domain-containing protein [Thermoanaerobaculia bacterium]